MPRPKLNVELLDRTMAEVAKAARRRRGLTWGQDRYRVVEPCRTAMCFAGWAVHLDGGEWVKASPLVRSRAHNEGFSFPVSDGSMVVHAGDRAQRILGLTLEERWALFKSSNTLRDLRRIVRDIKKGTYRA